MPELPPIEAGAYLVGYLLDVGPTVSGAMGAGPVTSKELMAWCEETGIRLQPWEAQFIRRLSGEYLTELHRAEKRDCDAPWKTEVVSRAEKLAAGEALKRHLMGLAKL